MPHHRIHPNAAWRDLGDRVVAITPDNRQHELDDEVALLVWRALDAGDGALDALADRVVTAFEVDHATARADLETFLSQMVSAGLILRS